MWKYLVIIAILLLNLAFARPSLADRPKFTKNPDYIEVTKTLKDLSATTEKTPEITQKIADLEFLKYTIESGVALGQCTNNTGKLLAVYGRDPDDDDDDYKSAYDNELYFLADGQTTDSEWDCDGFYIPNDVKAVALNPSGKAQELTGGSAVKILDGTQLVVKTNADTGNLEFNAPLSKVFQAGEVNWYIPKVAQATIDTRVPNAPIE
jgi:hypothetical protein